MPLPCRFDAVSGYGDGKADIFIAHIMDDTVSVFHAILISGKQPLDRSLRRRAVLIILAEPSILPRRYSPLAERGKAYFGACGAYTVSPGFYCIAVSNATVTMSLNPVCRASALALAPVSK